jgi:hypothetical protein
MNPTYFLDGHVCNVSALCAARCWPRDLVTAALRASADLTTDQLRQIVVTARSQPIFRPIPEANRQRNGIHGETYLTKQARLNQIRFGRGR